MTANLQPGDKIFLAFPLNLDGDAPDLYRFYKNEFAKQGVEVVFWASNSALTHPVVVAVFRNYADADSSSS